MTRNFKRYTIEEYISYLDNFDWQREINEIHVHHTWKPSIADFVGERTIWAMWNYHVNTRGWSDIGQHANIDPEGYIWDGRDLNRSPASILGRNGSPYNPFMFEMIGNFDKGYDKLEGEQLDTTLRLCSFLMDKFNLSTDKIVFHREYASKSCPGTGIDKKWFVDSVSSYNKIDRVVKELGKFIDVYDKHWAAPAINEMREKGLLGGKTEDTFAPNDNVTRAELAVVMKRIIDHILKEMRL